MKSAKYLAVFSASLSLIATLGIAAPALADGDVLVDSQLGAADALNTCQENVSNLEDSDVVSGIPDVDTEGPSQFVCSGDAVQLTYPTPDDVADITIVADSSTGEVVDVTGMTTEEIAENAPEVVLDEPAEPASDSSSQTQPGSFNRHRSTSGVSAHLAISSVVSLYRSQGSSIITYGENIGAHSWVSQVRVSMWLSLSWVHHSMEVTFTPLAAQQVEMQIPVRMQRTGFPFSSTVDTGLVWPTGYSSATVTTPFSLGTPPGRQEKYYPEAYNTKLWDRVHPGVFNVALGFTLPTFQCYKTVQCKYPNLRPA